ncbi:tRNA (adenine(37)-N6)-methyltransferase [Anopheles bellator]|uniref:tRNA (adenine(37)-N6)-methyltransferase n=1 Tax=Anopheles bellator TaxID=139047 RepID=UPI002646FEE5|nr:tRNA (adenine(37)-N6)-methyltransferase [Anopheles bellator]
MSSTDCEFLKGQLVAARNEIKNLRQQITSLQHMYRKEHQTALKKLDEFSFQERTESNHLVNKPSERLNSNDNNNDLKLKPIGVIRNILNEKRGVPRQASLSSTVRSRIDLSSKILNNPEHALEGLENYSHFWIIYHFHRHTDHTKTKVAPPRLDGIRVGVFSTRSPHRPCPIGLSLVRLDKIEGSKVYFFGTDMVDGTPVLDIKPFIPQYDTPVKGNDIGNEMSSREAPDGEENSTSTQQTSNSGSMSGPLPSVFIPNWVLNSSVLDVAFCLTASAQVQDLGITQASIIDILKTDPRSAYLRTKYASDIYRFQLGRYTVTCKFNDQNSTVTVLQVRDLVNVPGMAKDVINVNDPVIQ